MLGARGVKADSDRLIARSALPMQVVLQVMVLSRCRFVSKLVTHECWRVVDVALVASFDRLIGRQFVKMASFHLLVFAKLVRLNRLLLLLRCDLIKGLPLELIGLLHKLLRLER